MADNYYPEEKPFTEVSIKYVGDKKHLNNLLIYLKLLYLSKRLKLQYPEFIVKKEFFASPLLAYWIRGISNSYSNVYAILNALIKNGIKINEVPNIEFTTYTNESISTITLEEYLNKNNLDLESVDSKQLLQVMANK